MKQHLFRDLTPFEWTLWILSVCAIAGAFFLSGSRDILTITASLIGVTALLFVAKGYVFGQIMTIVFAVLYGVMSFFFRYYGEMLTYLCMTAPMAIVTAVAWLKHPFQGTQEVEIHPLTKKQALIMMGLSTIATFLGYELLAALKTANLLFSTISVTTSFIASYLTFLRSPYYALGYAANDLVLIVLWGLAAVENPAYLPTVVCFVMFLANDIYGFFNWRRMQRRQSMS